MHLKTSKLESKGKVIDSNTMPGKLNKWEDSKNTPSSKKEIIKNYCELCTNTQTMIGMDDGSISRYLKFSFVKSKFIGMDIPSPTPENLGTSPQAFPPVSIRFF